MGLAKLCARGEVLVEDWFLIIMAFTLGYSFAGFYEEVKPCPRAYSGN